jgi:hypothetical protein
VLSSAIAHLRTQRRCSEVYKARGSTSLPPGTRDFVANVGQLGSIGVSTMAPRPYADPYRCTSRRHGKEHPEPLLPVETAQHCFGSRAT